MNLRSLFYPIRAVSPLNAAELEMDMATPGWRDLFKISKLPGQEDGENTMDLLLPATLTFAELMPVCSEAFPFLYEKARCWAPISQ